MRNSDVLKRIENGPVFLLLGQRYLALERGSDPLVADIRRKFETTTQSRGYFDLFTRPGGDPEDTILAWLDERCRRIVPPDWLSNVAQVPWSGVFSSAIDSIWPGAFRLKWRDIQPIFDDRYRPLDPRNRRTLHCVCCFGLVNRLDRNERPPLTAFELSARTQTAVALLRRLPELLTPFGTLLIEGYGGREDWLTPEVLMPALSSLAPGQVHLFSANQLVLDEPYVQEMVGRQIVVGHADSLGLAVSEAVASGIIRLGLPNENAAGTSRVTVGDTTIDLPPELRNQVQHSAAIVDDLATMEPPSLSPDASYREFREFLATSDGTPRWTGFSRGFAFARTFARDLQQAVELRLKEAVQLPETPLLVHGQTGTGKTVALGGLAHAIRTARSHSVLYIERRSRRPNFSDIETFCRWCEEKGSPASLIVWDGMLGFPEYAELQRYLASRGRKAVVVGSAYIINDLGKNTNAILAPAELSETEQQRFADFLRSVDSTLGPLADRLATLNDGSFLVALYRLLPPTRAGVRAGLAREIEQAEALVAARAAEQTPEPHVAGVLGAALLKAGLVREEGLSRDSVRMVAGESLNDFQDLTALLMVPGRHGIRVPIEILLRTIGHEHFSGLVELLKGVDIIRWFEDEGGNIDLGPRNALEARLLVQSRIGGPAAEIAFVRRLLGEIHDVEEGMTLSREGAFAADLIRSFGPNSPESGAYAPFFRDLAQALRDLRETRGVRSLGLMLAEANLRREWSKTRGDAGEEQMLERLESLKEAKTVLQEALADTDPEPSRHRRIRAQLFAELAATVGMECRQAVQDKAPTSVLLRLVGEVREAVFRARREDPGAYHPLDIFSWVAPAVLKSPGLSEQQRAELTSDLVDLFQAVEASDFDMEQQHRFHARRMEIAEVLGDLSLSDASFQRLREIGSTAGYYVRATQLAGGFSEEGASRDKACDAAAYLGASRADVQNDPKCLTLLLRFEWLCKVGVPLLSAPRTTPALDVKGWTEILSLVRDIEATGLSRRPIDLAFLRGVALFHIGAVGEAFEVFRNEVENESRAIHGRRRIIRTFLAATPDGTPRKFHGTVSWVTGDQRRGEVYVEELRRNVHFLVQEFRSQVERGQSLGEFHIAFNLLGPLAEPAIFAVEKRKDGRRL